MVTDAYWRASFARADTRSRMGAGVVLLLLSLVLGLLAFGAGTASASTKKALVLDASGGAASSPEALRAADLGFPVTAVNEPTWGAMTASDFAAYQLVIVPDGPCGSMPKVVTDNATALSDAVMGRAGGTGAGNRILIGTDPALHYSQGGNKMIDATIDFAGAQAGATGLSLDFHCSDPDYDGNGTPDGVQKLLPLLSAAPSPTWTENPAAPCGGDVSLISNAAQFASLHSTDIRGWGCSVHETFPTFPPDWTALAIATDAPTKPTCGKDVDSGETRCGEGYLIISGSGITSEAPNMSLTPKTATNPVGTTHTITAFVHDDAGAAIPGVAVSFIVTGANAGATGTCNPSDCKSGADGKVTFTYTGTKAGDDTVFASATINESRQTATAAKKWVASEAGQIGCVRRPISLVRADPKGKKVVLSGLVAPQYAGNSVRILANYSAKSSKAYRLVTVKAKSNGEFSATIKRPKGKRFVNARYRATVGKFRSPALKLPQSLVSRSVKEVGSQIEVRGRVKRSLLGKRNPVVVKRLVCGRYRTVGTARPDRKGNYVVRFTLPPATASTTRNALFRAESKVLLNRKGSKRYVKQYARAISIRLTSQTG